MNKETRILLAKVDEILNELRQGAGAEALDSVEEGGDYSSLIDFGQVITPHYGINTAAQTYPNTPNLSLIHI